MCCQVFIFKIHYQETYIKLAEYGARFTCDVRVTLMCEVHDFQNKIAHLQFVIDKGGLLRRHI